jgi:hypothetical protein
VLHAREPVRGSTLGDALSPVPRSDGTTDLYISQDRFREQFAADVPAAAEHYMARRAGAHRTTEIPGASHAIAVAHPDATARLILHAAAVHPAVA